MTSKPILERLRIAAMQALSRAKNNTDEGAQILAARVREDLGLAHQMKEQFLLVNCQQLMHMVRPEMLDLQRKSAAQAGSSGATLGDQLRAKGQGIEIGQDGNLTVGGGHVQNDTHGWIAPSAPIHEPAPAQPGAAAGGHSLSDARPHPAASDPTEPASAGAAGRGQPSFDNQRARVSPDPSLYRSEAARFSNSILYTMLIDGVPLADCTAAKANAWATKHERLSRFVRLLTAGMQPDMVIGICHRRDEAERLYAQAVEESGTDRHLANEGVCVHVQ